MTAPDSKKKLDLPVNNAASRRSGPAMETILAIAEKTGCPLLCAALKLFYAARKSETPAWARGVMIGALIYLVTPLDAVPDLLPGVGYTDDLSIILAALGTVALYIDENVTKSAEETARKVLKRCKC